MSELKLGTIESYIMVIEKMGERIFELTRHNELLEHREAQRVAQEMAQIMRSEIKG